MTLDDHIAATVAAWPAPTPEMVRKVTLMLMQAHGYKVTDTDPEPPRVSALRAAEAQLAKMRRDFTDAMDGCHGCGISRTAHKHQEGHGLGYHAFEALSPDGAIKVAQVYKKKIAAAEKALDQVRAA